MKVTITRDWCEQMAKREGDGEIGAGSLARDPSGQEYHLQVCEECGGDGIDPREEYGDPLQNPCPACLGMGNEWVEVEPITMNDLDHG